MVWESYKKLHLEALYLEQQTIQDTQGIVQEIHHQAPLTSSELANLWRSNTYYAMLRCFYKHFSSTLVDPELRPSVEYCLSILEKRVNRSSEILSMEGQPIPKGFGDEDIDLGTPRLFTDLFIYHYTLNMIKVGIPLSATNFTNSVRTDVRDFYTECITSTTKLANPFIEIMLEKGIYVRPSIINTFKEIDIVKKQNFLSGFLGERRPLLAQEISQLFLGIRTNQIGGALLTGFKQSAKSEQVRAYMARGAEIARKHLSIFNSALQQEDIPVPMPSGELVTDSTIPPFSDKLMMEHVVVLGGIGVGNYATSVSTSLRHDLSASYVRLITEAANYGEDGINIMIENGWFEEPLRTIDRRELGKEQIH